MKNKHATDGCFLLGVIASSRGADDAELHMRSSGNQTRPGSENQSEDRGRGWGAAELVALAMPVTGQVRW